MDSRQPVTRGIISLYKSSFECNLMNGKLKYASMLYCSGQYDMAADMLNHCEGLLGPHVQHFCGCKNRCYIDQPHMFLEKTLNTSVLELLKTSGTTCVMFSKHELPCVPEHLRFEMSRTQTQQDWCERNRNSLATWMDMVVIDCIPFCTTSSILYTDRKAV